VIRLNEGDHEVALSGYIGCTPALYIKCDRTFRKSLILLRQNWLASPTEVGATRFFNGLHSQTGITALFELKGLYRDLQTRKPRYDGVWRPPTLSIFGPVFSSGLD
jgi:hypothetical protein